MTETESKPQTLTAERAELETVLASEMFRRAPTLARILEYLCESQLRGESFIKEYEIATQVMGRSADFDPQQDGSVRVNVHHLRKKLKQFYETEGANHLLWISLPVGQNLPSFVAHAQNEFANFNASDQIQTYPPQTGVPQPGTLSDPGWEAPAACENAEDSRTALVRRYLDPAFVACGLIAMALVGAALTWLVMSRQKTPQPRSIITDATIRIGTGLSHPYQDTSGRVWQSDSFYSGGSSFHRALPQVDGASDPTIYTSGREGNFSYDIPLPHGVYEVHLYFAESLVHGEGFRTMNIAINGKRAEQMLDITSDTGGFAIATGKTYTGVHPAADGKLHLQFSGKTLSAFINAIEIMPGNGDLLRPIRQSTSTNYIFDPRGTVWTPDTWFRGGRLSVLTKLFPELPVEGIFQQERFGNFSYAIPVPPNQTYNLTLYFQDAWFSHAPKEKISSGKRRFDVTCNGKELVKQLDILGEANGGFQITKHFTGLTPTSQGKLLLNFTPRQNYAQINAMVIEQETPQTPEPGSVP